MKNNNQLLSLGIIILLLSNCTSTGYKIEGKIDGASNQTLQLNEIGVRDIIPHDTVIINEDGSFKFKGKIEHPKFFTLQLSKYSMITLLVNPNDKITFKTNADNFTQYSVSGSKGSVLLKELNDKLNESISKVDSIGREFRKNKDQEDYIAHKAKLDSIYYKIIENHHDYLIGFIEQNHASLACIPALFQQISAKSYVLDVSKDFKYFKMVDTALMARYAELEQVKAINAFVKDNERKIKERELNEKILGIGALAPDITLTSPQGDTLSLSALKGKYVLLDFWAAWCKPCRAENTNLVRNYMKYKDKGFEIFQVSLDKTKDAWIQAIDKDNLDWVHVSDLQYWNSGPARLYNIRSIPASFLLDKEGKIIAKDLRGTALGAKLATVLANE